MSRRSAVLAVGVLAALAFAPAVLADPVPTPDPFYAAQLRDGELLFDQGKTAAAAKSLRTACFGLLDVPPALARCLVRLGLAQGAGGDAGGFRETFSRLIELERSAPSYAAADVPPAVRVAFEQQLIERIPNAALAASPTFSALAAIHAAGTGKKGKPRPEAPAPAEKPKPSPSGVVAPPPPAAVPSRPGPAPPAPSVAAAPPAAKPAAPPPPSPPAPVPDRLTADDRAVLTAARERMLKGTVAADLASAAADAERIADAHPGSIEANALAGEIAYRLSHWPAAVTFLRRSGPPPGAALLGFYFAVALFESGDQAGAAATLRPLLGKLQHTPYVEGYVRKILPPPATP